MARTQRILIALFLVSVNACRPSESPQTGSQTNWLRACDGDAACGDHEACRCNVCTAVCSSSSSCAALPGSTCVAAQDPGLVALCGGAPPPEVGLCLPRCGDTICAEGQTCVAGVCNPQRAPGVTVTVDEKASFQSLTGIGATLAYAEPSVLAYPRATELFGTMFADLGLDVLRLRNRYGYTGDDDLRSAVAIVDAATVSLGRKPTVILTSWSPPAELKSNAATSCHANPDSCTLLRSPNGSFDYDAYSTYWRSSLNAYLAAGLVPDYVSMQNNPDYVPTNLATGEACKFLPREGSATVSVNGVESTLRFPGYAEALVALSAGLTGFEARPRIIAPDVSTPGAAAEYLDAIDPALVDAIGHHLYGVVPTAPDLSTFRSLREVGANRAVPLFQTEMPADGLGTAILLHHSLVTEEASAYLHSALVGPAATSSLDPGALIVLSADRLDTQLQYQSLQHFALHTDPGWVRVSAASDDEGLLASAWMSPAGDALSIVLINPGTETTDLAVATSGSWESALVFRTTFDGTERHAGLGSLTDERVLRMPGHSLATVVLRH